MNVVIKLRGEQIFVADLGLWTDYIVLAEDPYHVTDFQIPVAGAGLCHMIGRSVLIAEGARNHVEENAQDHVIDFPVHTAEDDQDHVIDFPVQIAEDDQNHVTDIAALIAEGALNHVEENAQNHATDFPVHTEEDDLGHAID